MFKSIFLKSLETHNFQPTTFNPQLSTRNLQLSTRNPQPSRNPQLTSASY